jgi:arylsulfatase A-like enzyme
MLLAPLSALGASEPTTRPNILFLLADDWGWPHASCLGDPVVKTPTFDRIAREGVMFRNAYSTSPSCSPSRASILTGQWPGRLDQGASLLTFLPVRFAVYPDLLEKAGYFVGATGKGYAPAKSIGWKHNPAGANYRDFDQFLAQRPKGTPFCYWFGSRHPHRPYQPGCGIKSGMDATKVPVPSYLPDSPEVRSDICDYYFNVQTYDQEECGSIIAALERTGELDHTIIVMTGDNGWPFPRCKATNYDTGTHQTLAIRWGGKIKAGRVVDDFMSLSDLAPTFLEAAGLPVPPDMTARSLMPLMIADGSGQIDPRRDHVLTLMETHVPCRALADGGNGGYPRRSIITHDLHYIRNFHPERWPAGDPNGFEKPGAQPFSVTELSRNTFVAYADIDASPSKAYLVTHRDQPAVKHKADVVLARHPAQELYDLQKDPDELVNLADDPRYASKLHELDSRLMAELTATGDPRATNNDPDRFDRYNTEQSQKPAWTENLKRDSSELAK